MTDFNELFPDKSGENPEQKPGVNAGEKESTWQSPANDSAETDTYSYGRNHDYGRSFDQRAGGPSSPQSPGGRPGGYGQTGSPYGQRPQNTTNTDQTYNSINQNPYSSTSNPYGQQPYGQPPQQGYGSTEPQRPAYQWNFNDYGKVDPYGGGEPKPKKKKAGKIVAFASIALVLVAACSVGIYALVGARTGELVNEGLPETSSEVLDGGEEDVSNGGLLVNDMPEREEVLSTGGILTTNEIYKKLVPSIIGIQTYSPTTLDGTVLSEGSGVIMSEDGYIITNAHVIAGNPIPTIKVVLSNDESYEATIVGTDSKTDLAVLKIEADGLVAAEFGDSEALEIGDKVVAIGNPGGLAFASSTTQGIVSGVNRQLTDSSGATMACIQTDAAINPGNSGGALVNEYGQVIGITSSKISGEAFEGMGFAIPIHEAKPIIEDLLANGRVTGRPMIGITYSPVEGVIDEMLSRMYGLPTGVIIQEVNPESDAYVKGILAGDILHQINDTIITDVTDINAALDNLKPGDEVSVVIFRRDDPYSSNPSGREITFSIILMENPG